MKNYVNAFVEIVSLDETDVIATSIAIAGPNDGDVVGFDKLFPTENN